MVGIHMAIGIGEAIITAIVLAAIARARPELVEIPTGAAPMGWRGRSLIATCLVLAIAMAILSPLASSSPDGLERVAEKFGFAGRAAKSVIRAPLPDYRIPGIGSAAAATVVAGVIGTIIAFALALVLATVLVPRSAREKPGSLSQ